MVYADDMIITAESEEALKKQMHNIGTWLEKWDLKMNFDKSKMMSINISRPKIRVGDDWRFRIGNKEIVIQGTNTYEYLGINFNKSCGLIPHRDKQIKRANRLLGLMKVKADQSPNRFITSTTMWKQAIIPALLRACGCLPTSKHFVKQMEVCHTKAARWLLRLSRGASGITATYEFG